MPATGRRRFCRSRTCDRRDSCRPWRAVERGQVLGHRAGGAHDRSRRCPPVRIASGGERDRGRMSSMMENFAGLSTPLVADACIRSEVPLRIAPPGIAAVLPGLPLAGRAVPARHYGSVDVFLEALSSAGQGDVLVIDNGGRTDEACIGDLVALEAQA